MKKIVLPIVFVAIAVFAVYFFKSDPTEKSDRTNPIGTNQAFSNQTPETAVTREPSSPNAPQQTTINEMTRVILSIARADEVKPKALQVLDIARTADPGENMPGVQLIAGYMKILLGAEGLVYRLRTIVEPSDWLHMTALNGLRAFRYNDYLYGQHVLAIFDYVTRPVDTRSKPKFSNITDLQQFVLSDVVPLFEDLTRIANKLEAVPHEQFAFEIDRRLMIGEGADIRFLDPSETRKRIIKPNLFGLSSVLQRSLGAMYYWSAIQMDDLPTVSSQIVAATTINEMRGRLRSALQFDTLAKGVTPEMIANIVERFPRYFTFRGLTINAAGKPPVTYTVQQLLDKAFSAAQRAASLELAAYNCVIEYTVAEPKEVTLTQCVSSDGRDYANSFVPNGRRLAFNPNEQLLDYKIRKAELQQRNRLFSEVGASPGRFVQLTSEVTGATVDINVRALFSEQNPPRRFFPTRFEKSGQPTTTSPFGDHAWNYEFGRPTAYGNSGDFTFGGFFNRSTVSNLDSMYKAMTTLVYTKSLRPFAVMLPVPSPVAMPIFVPGVFEIND